MHMVDSVHALWDQQKGQVVADGSIGALATADIIIIIIVDTWTMPGCWKQLTKHSPYTRP